MNHQYVLLYMFLIALVSCHGIPCDSCGNECSNACGTKRFRSCCFNYLRKRSEVETIQMVTNKKLTDYIMLQRETLLTRNEMSSRIANILLTSAHNSINLSRPFKYQDHSKTCVEGKANCVYD